MTFPNCSQPDDAVDIPDGTFGETWPTSLYFRDPNWASMLDNAQKPGEKVHIYLRCSAFSAGIFVTPSRLGYSRTLSSVSGPSTSM
jgi:hypothetical protein